MFLGFITTLDWKRQGDCFKQSKYRKTSSVHRMSSSWLAVFPIFDTWRTGNVSFLCKYIQVLVQPPPPPPSTQICFFTDHQTQIEHSSASIHLSLLSLCLKSELNIKRKHSKMFWVRLFFEQSKNPLSYGRIEIKSSVSLSPGFVFYFQFTLIKT